MKRAIMTGGTGMIGHALIECLLQKDVEVTILVRKDSKRVECLPDNERVKIITCDLSSLATLYIPEKGYDVFFHLGWVGTFGDVRNDIRLQNKNIEYTLDAVELAYRLGCKVFVGAGSQAEYGRVDGKKLAPSTPAMPENGYGIAKLCAGQMSRIIAQNYGIKHIWLRVLSIYGPYDGNQTMVMSSIIKMLKGESPQYTLAEQMWDYLYCEDAAEAFYGAAEKGRDGAVYCVGSGKVRLLKEYIEVIRDVINPNIVLNFGAKPYTEKQVMYLCADISDLQEDIDFTAKYTFEKGIEKTVEWYRRSSR